MATSTSARMITIKDLLSLSEKSKKELPLNYHHGEDDETQTWKNKFLLPDYQRGYEWPPAKVEKLLYDINEVRGLMNKSAENTDLSDCIFMGFLVVYPNKIYGDNGKYTWQENTQEETVHLLIDGQQRVTTISLVLGCLRDLLDISSDVLGDTAEEELKNLSQSLGYNYLSHPSRSLISFKEKFQTEFFNTIVRRSYANEEKNKAFSPIVNNKKIKYVSRDNPFEYRLTTNYINIFSFLAQEILADLSTNVFHASEVKKVLRKSIKSTVYNTSIENYKKALESAKTYYEEKNKSKNIKNAKKRINSFIATYRDSILENFYVLYLSVREGLQAYEIFESINEGLQLSKADLIRIKVYGYLPDKLSKDESEKCKDAWSKIENSALNNGFVLTELIRYIWVTENGDVSKSKLFNQIDNTYRKTDECKFLTGKASTREDKWKNFLLSSAEYCKYIDILYQGDRSQDYPAFIEKINTTNNREISKQVQKMINYVKVLRYSGVQTWVVLVLPLLIALEYKFIKIDEVVRFLRKLTQLTLGSYSILGSIRTQDYYSLIETIAREISSLNLKYINYQKDEDNILPKDETLLIEYRNIFKKFYAKMVDWMRQDFNKEDEFEEKFDLSYKDGSSKNNLIRYILCEIENVYVPGDHDLFARKDYDIEHIFPKNKDNFNNMKEYYKTKDPDLAELSQDELSKIINSISNLTMLETEPNESKGQKFKENEIFTSYSNQNVSVATIKGVNDNKFKKETILNFPENNQEIPEYCKGSPFVFNPDFELDKGPNIFIKKRKKIMLNRIYKVCILNPVKEIYEDKTKMLPDNHYRLNTKEKSTLDGIEDIF